MGKRPPQRVLPDITPDMLAATAGPGATSEAGIGTELGVAPLSRFGRFVLLRLIGEGGMGRVHAAYDEELDRKVALKLLHNAEQVSSEQRTRIQREAQAMARVSHPNVVHVYEVGEAGGRLYIAMEFIDGGTLSQWRHQEPRSWEEILQLYRAAGAGLLAAHRAGLIHRDFKPDNVLLGGDGRPRVADFGLARADHVVDASLPAAVPHASADPQPLSPGGLLATPLTVDGMLVGTPAYMAPEQYCGQPADARSDQFSFCAALYEALYQELPFAGTTLSELSANVIAGRLRSPARSAELPPQISQALRRGLAREPEQRFPSMAELLTALDIDPDRDPSGAPRARRIFIGMAIGMLASSVVALMLLRRFGQITILALAVISLALFLTTLTTALALRKTLLRNAFHRGLVVSLLVLSANASLMRLMAWRLGLREAQLIPLDLMATAGMLATIAIHYLKGAWFIVALVLGGALAAASYPAHAFRFGQLSYAAMGALMISLWIRAARANLPAAAAIRGSTTHGPDDSAARRPSLPR